MSTEEIAGYDAAWVWIRRLLSGPVRALLRPKVRGREHVPDSGAFMFVSNHESWWDIPALGQVQPRSIRYMAKSELFRVPVFGGIVRWGGGFPVRRGEPDRDALRIVHETMEGGGVVGIFIQGHRQAELEGAKAGAGRCAVVEDAPVIPVAIRGTRMWRPGRRIHITFGPPRTYERGDRRPAQAYRETADELMAEIRALYEQSR
jgi:1-acyl-sn-glycerol-3-phosphate acyltransferase